jgi:hypothetical protein
MSRKTPSQYTPAYRQRLERAAAKRGQTLEQLLNTPGARAAARGHARTPEHGPSIAHLVKAKGRREQWVVGKPGKRGGGRPTAKATSKALGNVKTPETIVTMTFEAAQSGDEEAEAYKRDLEEEEPEDEETASYSIKGAVPPSGQASYTSSRVVPTDQLRSRLDTIASLPKADQKAGLIQLVRELTKDRFENITDVLQISLSQTKT